MYELFLFSFCATFITGLWALKLTKENDSMAK